MQPSFLVGKFSVMFSAMTRKLSIMSQTGLLCYLCLLFWIVYKLSCQVVHLFGHLDVCCIWTCSFLPYLVVLKSGIARGSGWQDLGAYINLAAYYLCGIPVAVVMGFWVKMGGKGLWIGLQAGSFLQVLLLSAITSCIDWHKQVCLHHLFRGYRYISNG